MFLAILALLLHIIYATHLNAKIVWIYDSDPTSYNLDHKLYIESAKYYAQISGWSVRIINYTNVDFWLQKSHSTVSSNILENIKNEHDLSKFKILIQCTILQHYGGLWVDQDVIIKDDLTWIQKFKQLKHTKWRQTKNPQIIAFWKDNQKTITGKFIWAIQHSMFFRDIVVYLESSQSMSNIHNLQNQGKLYITNKLSNPQKLVKTMNFWILTEDIPFSFDYYHGIKQPKSVLQDLKQKYTQIKIWKLPKIVWVYWNEGISTAPVFIRKCRQNLKFFASIRNWQIRQLDELNIKQALRQIPQSNQISQIISKNPKFSVKVYDILKFAILSHYGGVWVDSSSLLVQDLGWIQKIFYTQKIQLKHGDSPQAFLMYRGYQNLKINKKKLIIPHFITSFIAADTKSNFIKEVLHQFIRLDSMNVTQIQNYAAKLKIQIDQVYKKVPELHFNNLAISIVLQKRLAKINQNQTPLESFNIWILSVTEGPQRLKAQNPLVSTRLFFDKTIEQLAFTNQCPKFLIKFSSSQAQYINSKQKQLKQCEYLLTNPQKCHHQVLSPYQLFLEDILPINSQQLAIESNRRLKISQTQQQDRQGSSTLFWGVLIISVIVVYIFIKNSIFGQKSYSNKNYNDLQYQDSSKKFSLI